MSDNQSIETPPQITSAEGTDLAAEDAVDQFCWTAAQVLRRILGLAQAGDEQGDADSPDTQEKK